MTIAPENATETTAVCVLKFRERSGIETASFRGERRTECALSRWDARPPVSPLPRGWNSAFPPIIASTRSGLHCSRPPATGWRAVYPTARGAQIVSALHAGTAAPSGCPMSRGVGSLKRARCVRTHDECPGVGTMGMGDSRGGMVSFSSAIGLVARPSREAVCRYVPGASWCLVPECSGSAIGWRVGPGMLECSLTDASSAARTMLGRTCTNRASTSRQRLRCERVLLLEKPHGTPPRGAKCVRAT